MYMSKKDIAAWIASNPYAYREAGGHDTLKRLLEEGAHDERQAALARVSDRYKFKVDAYLKDLNDPEAAHYVDDDCISMSSYEKEDTYRNALEKYKAARRRGASGSGFKAIAKRFRVFEVRLRRMFDRDQRRIQAARRHSSDDDDDDDISI